MQLSITRNQCGRLRPAPCKRNAENTLRQAQCKQRTQRNAHGEHDGHKECSFRLPEIKKVLFEFRLAQKCRKHTSTSSVQAKNTEECTRRTPWSLRMQGYQ